MLKKIKWRKHLWGLLFVVVFSLGATTGYFYFQKSQQANLTPVEIEKDIYVEFLSEVYDKIKENYWESITDEQLGNLFKLGIENLTEKPQDVKIKNKNDFEEMLTEIIKVVKEDKKKEFATKLANLVLINLKPLGRSRLHTTQERKDLEDEVKNINPETGQIEPTVFTKLVRPDILHLYIKKISPTTFDELKKATEQVDNIDGLDTLILDLRANVGGSIDVLAYLLGPFIGQNQYAYEFLHQGENAPYKTKIGWLPSLVRYKKIVVLIDDKTQSSAEIMTATLKKYNIGITIGTTTKGWGTIEAIINIDKQIDQDEKYSIFLVHSLTLRDDNLPIEGNGVNPLIFINDPGWESQLFAYFHYDELIKVVKEVWNKAPEDLD